MALLKDKRLKDKYKSTVQAAKKAAEKLAETGYDLYIITGGNKGQYAARCYESKRNRPIPWTPAMIKLMGVPYLGNNLFDPKTGTKQGSKAAK